MTAPATPAAPAVPGAAGTTDEPAGAGPAAAADGASPRRRPAGPWAIWALDIVLAALAAAVYFGAVHGTGVFPHLHVRLRWYELAAAFGLTEVYVIHLQFRAEAHSVSVNELPLVVGLVFAAPHDLILGQLAGAAAALILHRRQAPVKLCFNLANLSLQTVLAALVFHTVVAGHDPVSPIGWIAALLAAVTCAGVAIASIVIAIVLSEGHIPSRRAAQTFALGLAATFTTSNLGVVAVLLLASTPLAVAPLLVLTVVLVTAYRAYMSERSRRYSVEFLYNASQVMQGPELNRALVELLGHAREMFHADMAEVLVVTDEPDERIHRTTLGPGNDVQAMTATASPLSEAALRVGRSHQGATLLSKARGEMVPAGFKDAMVAPMRGEKKILGVLVVANPVGAVAGFDGDQLRLFETLASHVALTLENGRLEDSVAQLRELEKKLSFQAYHDPLTRLGNRALFRTRLEESIGRQGGGSRRMAVMFVDLDDFKTVNDSLGHDAGDQLLTIVGERITGCVRPMDLAARLGGDEFGIFLEDVDRADAARVARRILSAVRSPIVIEGRELFVQTSVGIVTGEHSSSVEEFLRNADMAMYTAKRNGKGCYEFFDPGMSSAVVSRQQLKADLERAVERHEFETHYQCMVDLDTQAVVGVEALVRWQHPDGKKRLPDEFIAMAEETGLIVPMGRQVLNDACMAARSWRDLIPELSVSVNLSARQLDDGPLIEDVCAALRNSGLPPESLILEITESITVADIDATVERLWELKTIGVQLAIDDFGTGYSSLSSLRRLPVDILKIPKPFVDGIGDAPTELAFVQAITRLGQTLRLELVAEGIEREDQYKRLKGLKCNVGQGFFFGRPVPVDVMTEFLREESLKQRRSAGLPAAAAAADDDGPSAVVIPLRAQA